MNDDVFAEINVVGDDAAFQLTVVFDSDAIVKNAVSGTSVNNFFLKPTIALTFLIDKVLN